MMKHYTRQIRLSDREQFKKRLPEFIGKKINIVLQDKTVLLGELKTVNADKLVIKNMRLKKIPVSLQQITEIYFDTTV